MLGCQAHSSHMETITNQHFWHGKEATSWIAFNAQFTRRHERFRICSSCMTKKVLLSKQLSQICAIFAGWWPVKEWNQLKVAVSTQMSASYSGRKESQGISFAWQWVIHSACHQGFFFLFHRGRRFAFCHCNNRCDRHWWRPCRVPIRSRYHLDYKTRVVKCVLTSSLSDVITVRLCGCFHLYLKTWSSHVPH